MPIQCKNILDNLKENLQYYLNDLKITTNSRWLDSLSDKPCSGNFIIPKRDYLPKPSNDHHGVWIAEIPFQMILRFTKENDIVWSQFGGSGVDYEVSKYLIRQCVITDLSPKHDYIIKADSKTFKLDQKAQLILSHPPYWDMVKYSDDENDLSNSKTLKEFLEFWKQILENSFNNLNDNGYFVFACGSIYRNSEMIDLGNIMLMFAQKWFILKQHIIKDYGFTKSTNIKNYNLNYYRALKYGYGQFYGDNIFIMKKRNGNKTDKIKVFETVKELLQ